MSWRPSIAAHIRCVLSVAITLLALVALTVGTTSATAGWKKWRPKVSFDPRDHLPNPTKPWEPPAALRSPGADLIPPELRQYANVCAQIQEAAKIANQFRADLFSALTNLPIPNDGILLLDHKTSGSFTYNAYAGSAGYKVTLPGGVELDKSKIKSTFEGSVSVPAINLDKLISDIGIIKVHQLNGYDDWANAKKENPSRHVFVSSKRFVDSISDNKVLQEVAWAILTGGSTTEGSIKALKEQIVLEWADILSWLERIGEENGPDYAREIAEELLKFAKPLAESKNFQIDPTQIFKPVKLKSLDLELKFHLVPYDYSISPPFASELNKVLALLKIKGKSLLETKVRETHLGYSISIKRSSPKNHKKQMESLIELMNKGPQANVLAFAEKISGSELNFKDGSITDVSGNKKIQDAFKKIFSGGMAGVEDKGDGVFEFRNTKGGKQLEENLRNLAVGNDAKDAKLRRLTVDVASATITLDVDLYHRYRMTKKEILNALNAALEAHDDPFEVAKDACKSAARICKKDVIKDYAKDVCSLVKTSPELQPIPPNVQLELAASSPSMAQADGPPTTGPYVNDVDTVGIKLPAWCFVRGQRYTFEITMDHVVRGLAIHLRGRAERQPNGAVTFNAEKPIDIGSIDWEMFTEKVSGTIKTDGELVMIDHAKAQYKGACRSVE